jgi:hypothetical protein
MATNTTFRRLERLILTLAVASAIVMPSRAGDWMPLLPDQDFYDFQLFAPPDLQDYEIYPEPSEGIFFNYDRLYWGITPPNVRGVGQTDKGGYLIPNQPISPQAIVQLNNASIQASGSSATNIIGGIYIFGADPLQLDLNTSWMRTKMAWGNRYEGGWIYDGKGVNISYFTVGSQSQEFQTINEFAAASPTQTFTQETESSESTTGGIAVPLVTTTIEAISPPPDHLISQKFTQLNSTEIQSAGAAAIIRRELGGRGSRSTARFSVGPRFIQFADRYRLGYESNQYPFNVGGTAGGTTGGGGATGGGGTGGTGAGGTTGGGTTGGGATGGGGAGNTTSQIGGGGPTFGIYNTSAGDVLGITGVDTLTGLGQSTPLQVGAWETDTFNNMVGPEFGLLFETQSGRWTFSSEFKFTAAFNWQNNLYRGANFPDSIGADYLRATFTPATTQTAGFTTGVNTISAPPLFLQLYGVGQSNATNAAEHRFVFSPIGEWRFGSEFKVSQAITLHAGYTGMWLGSIARASTNTAYKSVEKATTYAEPTNPAAPASLTNPWIVKSTGPRPAGVPPTDPRYTDPTSSYYRANPVYNRIAPVDGGQEYVFTNGVDFGITVKY